MCVPGREEAVLVRVAVDRVVEQVGADPAVVEQRVALARGAVADDLLALAAEPDQELEQRPLRLLHVLGEPRVALGRAQALVLLAREQLGDRGRRLVRAAGVLRVDAQRAAVRPQLLDVVDARARARARISAIVANEKYEKCSW